MRNLLLLIAIGSGLYAQPTPGNHTSGSSASGGNTYTMTLDSTAVAGGGLIAGCISGGTVSNVTDLVGGQNNNSAITYLTAGTNNASTQIFYISNPAHTGASHVFTVTGSGFFGSGEVAVFAGTGAFVSQGAYGCGLNPGSTSCALSTALTPTAVNQLGLSCGHVEGAGTISVASPFTALDTVGYSAGAHYGSGFGYVVANNTTAQAPSWSYTGGGAKMSVVGAIFDKASCLFTSSAGYLNLGFVGQSYSYTPATAGCSSPTFSITSGSLPAGLSLNSSTGAITGTPTTTGTSTFTLQASGGGTASQSDQIKIAAAPTGVSVAGNSAVTVRGFWTTDEASDTKLSCTDGTSTWNTPVVDNINAGVSALWGVTAHALSLVVYHPTGSVTCTGFSTYVTGGTGAVALGTASVLSALTTSPVRIANDAARTRHKMTWDGAQGSSGDIKFPAWGADGVYVTNNDAYGKALSSSAYCCFGHILEEKWAPDMRSTITMLGGAISGVTGVLPFSPSTNSSDLGLVAITGSSCSATNVATVNFTAINFLPKVGQLVWGSGFAQSFFNVSAVALTAASTTSVSFLTTCTNGTAWTSGGRILFWNDGGQFVNVALTSIAGSLYIMPKRSSNNDHSFLIRTPDAWASTLSNANNSPSATPISGWDIPVSTETCYFADCSAHDLMILQPCQDYGGTAMTQFACNWQAGDDAWIYALETNVQTSIGQRLWRIKYEDLKQMLGSKWQIFQGSQADSDAPLQDSQWLPFSPANVTSGTRINAGANAWGNSAQMIYIGDPFNRFVQIEWSALKTVNRLPDVTAYSPSVSQSAGAVVFDHGTYPWGASTVMGSINSDPSDVNFYPTWSRCYNSTYASISTNPPVGKLVCGQSGSYLNGGGGSVAPNVNEYGPNTFDLYLTARTGGSITSFSNPSLAYPRFSFAGGGNKHIANGLELFYDWTSCLTAGGAWKNLAPTPTGSWDTTLSNLQTNLCDSTGLKIFGFPAAGSAGWGNSNTATALPTKMVVGSGFNKALGDFTLIWVGRHLATANDGPPSGECAFASSTLSFCRSAQTANSWIFTVPDGSTTAQTVTTDGSNFAAAVMVRSGSTTTFYSNSGIGASGALTALTTKAGSTTTGANTVYVGGKSGNTNEFWGYMSYLLVWSRALGKEELRAEMARLRAEMAAAGGTLP